LSQEKAGKPWVFDGQDYKTLKALRNALYEDPIMLQEVENRIIERALEAVDD